MHPYRLRQVHVHACLIACAEMLWPEATCKVWCTSPLVSLSIRVWAICLVHCNHTHTTGHCERWGVYLRADKYRYHSTHKQALTLDVQHTLEGLLRVYTLSVEPPHIWAHLLSRKMWPTTYPITGNNFYSTLFLPPLTDPMGLHVLFKCFVLALQTTIISSCTFSTFTCTLQSSYSNRAITKQGVQLDLAI